jgi:hypothetical protein
MCKPGSACCGCAASSGGIGLAIGVVAVAGATSMAATLISDILTTVLVSVLSLAAGGSIVLMVILRRTRGVAPRLPGRARPALTAPQPLAITAPGRLRIVTRPGSYRLIRPGEQPPADETGPGHPSPPRVLLTRH